jgi:hypothetical protein
MRVMVQAECSIRANGRPGLSMELWDTTARFEGKNAGNRPPIACRATSGDTYTVVHSPKVTN